MVRGTIIRIGGREQFVRFERGAHPKWPWRATCKVRNGDGSPPQAIAVQGKTQQACLDLLKREAREL